MQNCLLKTRKLSYRNDERAMLSVQLVSNLRSPDPPTLPTDRLKVEIRLQKSEKKIHEEKFFFHTL